MLTVQLTRKRSAQVASLEEASRVVCADRDSRNVGSGSWYRALGTLDGAPVTDESGKIVARVAYNGRVLAAEA